MRRGVDNDLTVSVFQRECIVKPKRVDTATAFLRNERAHTVWTTDFEQIFIIFAAHKTTPSIDDGCDVTEKQTTRHGNYPPNNHLSLVVWKMYVYSTDLTKTLENTQWGNR